MLYLLHLPFFGVSSPTPDVDPTFALVAREFARVRDGPSGRRDLGQGTTTSLGPSGPRRAGTRVGMDPKVEDEGPAKVEK